MSEKEYLAKTKEDLVNLVRISGVMPITQARKMRKADLAAHLAQMDAQSPDRGERETTRKQRAQSSSSRSSGTQRSAKSRRSVFEVVLPEEDENDSSAKDADGDQPDISKKSGRDGNAPSGRTASRSSSRSQRSKMIPAASEEDSTDKPADASDISGNYQELERVLQKRSQNTEDTEASAETADHADLQENGVNESSESDPGSSRQKRSSRDGRRKKQGDKKTSSAAASKDAVSTDKDDSSSSGKPEIHVKDHRKKEEDSLQGEARPRPAGGSRQMTSKGKDLDSQTESAEPQKERNDSRGNQRDKQRKSQNAKQERGRAGTKEQTRDDDNQKDQSSGRSQQRQNQESVTGVLEIMPDSYGFLRLENYIQNPTDAYVPPQLIRRFHLRNGDLVSGFVREQRDQDRYRAVTFIQEVNGQAPEKMQRRPNFERLTPIYPLERFRLETVKNEFSTRIIDLFSPIGKGQRGMIVSPPKAGKTILLQKVANAVAINNPEAKLIVLLIDERPEEVTDMQRLIKGEVVYSTFDKTPDNHVRITELVLDRAKRMVELGEDVVILLDSMTRMARAYNSTINPTGRTLSGGLDPGALYGPKKFFGAARNIENGGSLTIVATSLVETGSRMDEVIFEEFKGTGNMEIVLDRKLSERRIFPAIDVNRSGTRREELLLTRKELESVWGVRKAFGHMETVNITEMVLNLLRKTDDNERFIQTINQTMTDKGALESASPRR